MAGNFSDYQIHEWLQQLNNTWVGLHFDNPLNTDPYATEIIGGGYTRQKVSFYAPSNRGMFSATPVVFTGLPSVTVTHVGGWSGQYDGNLLYAIEMPKKMFVNEGGTLSWTPTDFALSFF